MIRETGIPMDVCTYMERNITANNVHHPVLDPEINFESSMSKSGMAIRYSGKSRKAKDSNKHWTSKPKQKERS